jgi:probable HAF family extracellular repeat protein
MRRNLIAVLGVTALCVPALAGTAPLYSVTYLPYSKGSLGTYGINAAGHAAGEIDTPGAQAAAWIASGERDLGYLDRPYQYCYQSHAYAINDSDMVVGLQHFVSCAYHTGDLDRAFYWTQAAGMQEIAPPTGFDHSRALDINNAGTVIGNVATATSPSTTQGFRWTKAAGLSLLGTFGGTNSTAVAINGLGHVVGTADLPDGTTHLYLLKHDGTLTSADDIYPVSGNVMDVNDADQVLLWDGAMKASIWQDGQTTVLPNIPGTVMRSQPYGMNKYGDVVGIYYDSNYTNLAFLYKNGAMVDLTTLLPAHSGWRLIVARAINDAGQITGWGSLNGTGYADFLLTPIVYGDANGDGKVDMTDVTAMLQSGAGLASGPPLQSADVAPNPSTDPRGFGDGVVDIQDALRTLRYITGLETTWP